MPAPIGSRHADQESVPALMGGEGGGKHRGQGGDGTVHQSGEAGLHDLQDEEAAAGAIFILFYAGAELFFLQFLGAGLVAAFDGGEVIEQLPDAGIFECARPTFHKTGEFRTPWR